MGTFLGLGNSVEVSAHPGAAQHPVLPDRADRAPRPPSSPFPAALVCADAARRDAVGRPQDGPDTGGAAHPQEWAIMGLRPLQDFPRKVRC